MNISLLEPIGVSNTIIDELAGNLITAGHTFTRFNTKTTDPAELANLSRNQDIVIITNNPYPAEVIREVTCLKMIDTAFTGIGHLRNCCKQATSSHCMSQVLPRHTI